ncbi:ester cyclase [Deinococcus sonorensis]|uniref:Ester cyclase n=2 Tax=Deinococcus sonorensis TaxID=309891 RepID=A0AAU7U5P3_9DEIO
MSTSGLVLFLQGFIVGFPDLHSTVERMVPRGDTVVLFVTGEGTFGRPFMVAP